MQSYSEVQLLLQINKYFNLRNTCLVDSMVIQSVVYANHRIVIPIKLGVCINENFIAHAWNGSNNTLREFKAIEI